MSKALRTDDSVTTCECCGRSNLKFTVVVELDNGETAYYGQVCAARNTGKTPAVIQSEIKEALQRVRDAAAAEYRQDPARRAYDARLQERPRELVGKAAMEFVREQAMASSQARIRIAAAFGLKACEVPF